MPFASRHTAFSRPATALSRVGIPISRAIQLKTTRNYLEGVRRYVSGKE